MADRAKLGDQVTVRYFTAVRDGDSMQRHGGRQMLRFMVGSKDAVPGVSFGVVGMAEGEKKRLTLKPEEAFGRVRGDRIHEISRRRFPSNIRLEVGKWLARVRRNSGRRQRTCRSWMSRHQP